MPRVSGPTRAQLISEIRANFAEINIRAFDIKREVEETGIPSEFLSTQRSIFKSLTNTVSRNKISTGNLSRFNKTRLSDILEQQKLFLSSKWSTPEGREEIRQRQFETLQTRVPNLTEEQFDNMRGFFAKVDNIYDVFVESGLLTSDQVVDMISSGVTESELISAFDRISEYDTEGIMINEMPRDNIRAFIQYTATNPDESIESIYAKFSDM